MMMRDYIAPALREIGFKGSGQTYTFPSDTHWASIHFQKSAYSDAAHIKFTLHLLVVRKDEWDALRQARPGMLPEHPPSFYGSPARSWTVSHELPADIKVRHGLRPDFKGALMETWWELQAGQPIEPLANLVLATVRDEALPRMREFMT